MPYPVAACFVFVVVAADCDCASHLRKVNIRDVVMETVWLRDDGVISVKFDHRNRMRNPL